jgi:hypothetical protein
MGSFKNVIGEVFAEHTEVFLCTHGMPSSRKRFVQREDAYHAYVRESKRSAKRIERMIARENAVPRTRHGKTIAEHQQLDKQVTTLAMVENASADTWVEECARVRKMLK